MTDKSCSSVFSCWWIWFQSKQYSRWFSFHVDGYCYGTGRVGGGGDIVVREGHNESDGGRTTDRG